MSSSWEPKSLKMGPGDLREEVPGTDWAPKASEGTPPTPKLSKMRAILDPHGPQNEVKRQPLRVAIHPTKKKQRLRISLISRVHYRYIGFPGVW